MEGPMFKNRRDPRITRIGRFLRKTSLDETPQLFHVLLGQMSLVGPRPDVNEVVRFEAWQRQRLSVQPGLTCLWQISGRNELSFVESVRMDLWYVRHQNFRTDWTLLWANSLRPAHRPRRLLGPALETAMYDTALATCGQQSSSSVDRQIAILGVRLTDVTRTRAVQLLDACLAHGNGRRTRLLRQCAYAQPGRPRCAVPRRVELGRVHVRRRHRRALGRPPAEVLHVRDNLNGTDLVPHWFHATAGAATAISSWERRRA